MLESKFRFWFQDPFAPGNFVCMPCVEASLRLPLKPYHGTVLRWRYRGKGLSVLGYTGHPNVKVYSTVGLTLRHLCSRNSSKGPRGPLILSVHLNPHCRSSRQGSPSFLLETLDPKMSANNPCMCPISPFEASSIQKKIRYTHVHMGGCQNYGPFLGSLL